MKVDDNSLVSSLSFTIPIATFQKIGKGEDRRTTPVDFVGYSSERV